MSKRAKKHIFVKRLMKKEEVLNSYTESKRSVSDDVHDNLCDGKFSDFLCKSVCHEH